ncbi:hypothetical protein R5W24_002451 [Gemmata sp. JC717]|uniref:hypothetical protein n=1 Tax=Gemmata algarum TaxID=2975278 RepID=UPI0021BA9159|nr:hypothetical protein [Gemmata algarum]MDY3553350.1 hypothetical protein [Gemmata algarum]
MTETTIALAVAIASAVATPRAETHVKLTVDATAAPKPALRYVLLPELKELTPGNPIPAYMKCVIGQESGGTESPADRGLLQLADRAARMDKPDWQILPKLRTDGLALLLPDLQKMRQLSAALQERFRDEVARGRFDDAQVTAKTMFALARHMGEHPTLIGSLVAIALAQVAAAPFEEMLGQPGCPNFYWALTALPQPFVPLDKALEGERMLIDAELRDLDDQQPMTTAQLKKLIQHLERIDRRDTKLIDWLARTAKDADHMEAARARLSEHGIAGERVAQFSPYQVLLLDERREYEIQRDEQMKLVPLPAWEAVPRLKRVPAPKMRPIVDTFLPELQRIRAAQARVDQRLALLRHVEALRLHAAGHGGALPARLADVDVPVPVDPFTGKPFRYEVIDGAAHLWGTPPLGYEDNAAYNLHYEIVIRK